MSISNGMRMVTDQLNDADLSKKIYKAFDEYVEGFNSEVIKEKMFPINFPILGKVNICFCVGKNTIYILYEKSQSNMPNVYLLKINESLKFAFDKLAQQIVGQGLLTRPQGLTILISLLNEKGEKRKQILFNEGERSARKEIQHIKSKNTRPIVDSILQLQEKINATLAAEIFIDKYLIIQALYEPVVTQSDLITKIQSLNLLIDKMRISEFKRLIQEGGDTLKALKSIRLLEKYLLEIATDTDKVNDIINNLRNISTLSAGYPRHEGTGINERVEQILEEIGITNKKDYSAIWLILLKLYKSTLESIVELLPNPQPNDGTREETVNK